MALERVSVDKISQFDLSPSGPALEGQQFGQTSGLLNTPSHNLRQRLGPFVATCDTHLSLVNADWPGPSVAFVYRDTRKTINHLYRRASSQIDDWWAINSVDYFNLLAPRDGPGDLGD